MSRRHSIARASGPWAAMVAILSLVLSGAIHIAVADASESRISLADGGASSYRSVSARFGRLSFADDGITATSLGARADVRRDGGREPTSDDERDGDDTVDRTDDKRDEKKTPPTDDGEEYDDRPLFIVDVSADRVTASQGNVITYVVRARNLGSTPMSNVVLQAHVPTGTTLTDGGTCDVASVGLASPCVPTLTPDEEGHLSQLFLALPSDSFVTWTIKVRVNLTTRAGTVLSQHGHATADDSPLVTSDETTVIVI